mmetsp:Transcript_8767/g.26962  ORF Transcript_8767/g.26962 Transcript_8767/m.26962 type:complete len:309 (+) Transcript_8767:91-1017(+)
MADIWCTLRTHTGLEGKQGRKRRRGAEDREESGAAATVVEQAVVVVVVLGGEAFSEALIGVPLGVAHRAFVLRALVDGLVGGGGVVLQGGRVYRQRLGLGLLAGEAQFGFVVPWGVVGLEKDLAEVLVVAARDVVQVAGVVVVDVAGALPGPLLRAAVASRRQRREHVREPAGSGSAVVVVSLERDDVRLLRGVVFHVRRRGLRSVAARAQQQPVPRARRRRENVDLDGARIRRLWRLVAGVRRAVGLVLVAVVVVGDSLTLFALLGRLPTPSSPPHPDGGRCAKEEGHCSAARRSVDRRRVPTRRRP